MSSASTRSWNQLTQLLAERWKQRERSSSRTRFRISFEIISGFTLSLLVVCYEAMVSGFLSRLVGFGPDMSTLANSIRMREMSSAHRCAVTSSAAESSRTAAPLGTVFGRVSTDG